MTMLVLSGGGLWATAGIGAAAALRDMGFPIQGYIGSSAGAIVAALLAAGHTPEALHRAALSLNSRDFRVDWKSWIRRAVRGQGPVSLYRLESLSQRMAPFLGNQRWDTLIYPLWVTATSLTQFQPVVFGSHPPLQTDLPTRFHLGWRDQSTDLLTAIKASAALPGVFPPVRVGEEWLVDGGVADDYPVDVAQWVGAEDLVGLWVDEQVHDSLPKRFHAGHVASASLAVMIRELSVIRQRMVAIPHTDIRIEIDGGHRVFNRIADIIQQGYDATWARIDEIRERREHGA